MADSWAEGLGSDELGDGDFLFDGDVLKWQKFCNSLRLRIAMRISKVYGGSQAIIEDIFANPSKYPTFPIVVIMLISGGRAPEYIMNNIIITSFHAMITECHRFLSII